MVREFDPRAPAGEEAPPGRAIREDARLTPKPSAGDLFSSRSQASITPDVVVPSSVVIPSPVVVMRGYDGTEVLFVDDTPAMLGRSHGNDVGVEPYLGAPQGGELAQADDLDRLGSVDDVRPIEKRGWPNRATQSGE